MIPCFLLPALQSGYGQMFRLNFAALDAYIINTICLFSSRLRRRQQSFGGGGNRKTRNIPARGPAG